MATAKTKDFPSFPSFWTIQMLERPFAAIREHKEI